MHLVLLFILRILTPKDYTASHSHYINDKTGKTVDKICNSVAYTSNKGIVYPKQTLFSTKTNPFFIPLAAVLPNLPTVLQSLSTAETVLQCPCNGFAFTLKHRSFSYEIGSFPRGIDCFSCGIGSFPKPP
jgi:hypothetical protein